MITIIFTFYHDHDSLPHSDLDKLHDGIGDKLSYLIQFIATFFGGLVISFLKSWKVSLLLLGFIPIFAICACTLSKASCWAWRTTHGWASTLHTGHSVLYVYTLAQSQHKCKTWHVYMNIKPSAKISMSTKSHFVN